MARRMGYGIIGYGVHCIAYSVGGRHGKDSLVLWMGLRIPGYSALIRLRACFVYERAFRQGCGC